jgi:hypothetical protein
MTLEDVTDSEDDENDADEVKALKVGFIRLTMRVTENIRPRRRYLWSLLQSTSQEVVLTSQSPLRSRPRKSRKDAALSTALLIVPGCTALVVDISILLSSLSMFASVVESLRWTVIASSPAVMELDGSAVNVSPLAETAQAALAYITLTYNRDVGAGNRRGECPSRVLEYTVLPPCTDRSTSALIPNLTCFWTKSLMGGKNTSPLNTNNNTNYGIP